MKKARPKPIGPSDQDAASVRAKIDVLVAEVTAVGRERDDFDAIARREVKRLQAAARPRRVA